MTKEQREFMINLAHLVEELTKRVDFISNQLVNKANEVNQKFEPGFGSDGKLEEISLVEEQKNKIEINFIGQRPFDYHFAISKILMEGIINVCNQLKINKLSIDYHNQEIK